MATPPFDRATVSDALVCTREADVAVRIGHETSVINFAATLTPEERQKFTIGLARRTAQAPVSAVSKP